MSTDTDNALLIHIYDDLKDLLSRITRISEHLINANDTLAGDLGFTQSGLRSLADPINKEFAMYNVKIPPGVVAGCKTVSALALAIYSRATSE